jgi:hypothetical protein
VTGGAGSGAVVDEVDGGVVDEADGAVVLLDGDVAGLERGFTTTLGDGVRRSPAP